MDQVKSATVVVQSGAYGEHQISNVEIDGRDTYINNSAFSVLLEPGCGSKLVVKAKRYVNQPTFDFPFRRA